MKKLPWLCIAVGALLVLICSTSQAASGDGGSIQVYWRDVAGAAIGVAMTGFGIAWKVSSAFIKLRLEQLEKGLEQANHRIKNADKMDAYLTGEHHRLEVEQGRTRVQVDAHAESIRELQQRVVNLHVRTIS